MSGIKYVGNWRHSRYSSQRMVEILCAYGFQRYGAVSIPSFQHSLPRHYIFTPLIHTPRIYVSSTKITHSQVIRFQIFTWTYICPHNNSILSYFKSYERERDRERGHRKACKPYHESKENEAADLTCLHNRTHTTTYCHTYTSWQEAIVSSINNFSF